MLHRSWFPLVLAAASLLLAAVFGVLLQKREVPTDSSHQPTQSTSTVESPVDEGTYRQALLTVIAQYRDDNDAQKAYDTLLLLRVPVAYQQVHLDTVLLFSSLLTNGVEASAARLSALQASYPWLGL